jgi:hypothetical protein
MTFSKVFFTAALLFLGVSAFAQSTKDKGWSVYGQWNPSSFVSNDGSSTSFNAFSLGVNKAFPLSSYAPLYFETGLGFQYSFDSQTNVVGKHTEEYTVKVMSAKIPVSLGYNFQVPQSSVSFAPFAGLDFRGNIWGIDDDEEDLFSDDYYEWNRFQIGWHIGLNPKFNNNFLLGVSYGTDFNKLHDDTRVHTTSVTFGVCF